MSDHTPPIHSYVAIKRKMQRAANAHERQMRKAWVDRVLDILDNDKLITKAASGQTTENSLIFECNIAAHVWDDPRIVHRLRQLEGGGVAVELVDHETEIAGKTFKRTRIHIAFNN